MSASNLVAFDAPGVEPQIPNESEQIHALHGVINRVQQRNFSKHRHGFRGTHVKTQAIVKGQLTVLPDLPEPLSQGLFGNSGRVHGIALRFANEPSFLQDDKAPGPRGCGVKVFDVDGRFMDATGERYRTQDFTFNNAPLLELTDLPTTLEIFTLREKFFDDATCLTEELKKRADSDLQLAPQSLPNQHFLSYTMYSQSAFRFGNYVAKFALFPVGKMQRELALCQITEDSDPEQHSAWLREYFRTDDAEFDFRVQLLEDLDQQSVEDCSKPWDEEKFPFQTVARVVLPKSQDVFSPQRRVFWEDAMRLNVWGGLEAHRPLGSVNRLRRTLYQRSAVRRDELNARSSSDITSVDQIP